MYPQRRHHQDGRSRIPQVSKRSLSTRPRANVRGFSINYLINLVMKYYSYEMRKREIDALLQKYFDDNYGAVVMLDLNNNIDAIEICKLTKEGKATVWTHYANIINMDTSKNDNWEISESFIEIDDQFCKRWGSEYSMYIGTEQKAMNIYGYFKTLGGAIRNLAKNGTSENKRKPITIYV